MILVSEERFKGQVLSLLPADWASRHDGSERELLGSGGHIATAFKHQGEDFGGAVDVGVVASHGLFGSIDKGACSIGVQDRQCVTSSVALLGHLLLRSSRSDARGADTEQTSNRDRCRNPAAVITHLYATPDPRFSIGLRIGHQCRRGL